MITFITERLAKVATLAAAALVVCYTAISFAPSGWFGFKPGSPYFYDTESGEIPPLEFQRTIRWNIWARYRVTVRGPEHNGVSGNVACEAESLPFTYQPSHGPLVDKNLAWWAPQDPRCRNLEDGPYWVETCWFLLDPFGDQFRRVWEDFPRRLFGPLTPTKALCRDSNVFWIGPHSKRDVIQQGQLDKRVHPRAMSRG